ncbi:hypothetical protein [Anaerosacchariphilus polymeriproducens]|nr:hypothetical protein [Anaerosacchariphilus polymeriproducens]
MADIINIRLTKDCPEVSLMDTQAKALGIFRNDCEGNNFDGEL